jgi:hypothetical protein
VYSVRGKNPGVTDIIPVCDPLQTLSRFVTCLSNMFVIKEKKNRCRDGDVAHR